MVVVLIVCLLLVVVVCGYVINKCVGVKVSKLKMRDSWDGVVPLLGGLSRELSEQYSFRLKSGYKVGVGKVLEGVKKWKCTTLVWETVGLSESEYRRRCNAERLSVFKMVFGISVGSYIVLVLYNLSQGLGLSFTGVFVTLGLCIASSLVCSLGVDAGVLCKESREVETEVLLSGDKLVFIVPERSVGGVLVREVVEFDLGSVRDMYTYMELQRLDVVGSGVCYREELVSGRCGSCRFGCGVYSLDIVDTELTRGWLCSFPYVVKDCIISSEDVIK